MSLAIDICLVTCPRCDGGGEVGSWSQYRGDPPEDSTDLCGVCLGKGQVTPEIYERYVAMLHTVKFIENTKIFDMLDYNRKVAAFEHRLEQERDNDNIASL